MLAGTSKADLRLIKELTSSDAVEVLIDGFEEDTEFFWQCKHRQPPDDPWTESAVRICRTRRLSGTTFQLALFADSHYYSARSIPALVQNISQCMEAVRKGPHDFCVFLGDEAGVHFAGDRDARHSRDLARERWRQWRDVAADLLADVPSFMVLGNHEGEAGFYQEMEEERGAYLQRWGTIERKRHFLNPVPLTYPEGGENEYWRGTSGRGPTGVPRKAIARRCRITLRGRGVMRYSLFWMCIVIPMLAKVRPNSRKIGRLVRRSLIGLNVLPRRVRPVGSLLLRTMWLAGLNGARIARFGIRAMRMGGAGLGMRVSASSQRSPTS
ncbi:MAG: metallophosphoesterase family protein [Phycisphaerae bacterium]